MVITNKLQQYKNDIMEIGIDEAGRGPLIGRVYAGAVIWPENLESSLINDSKKLTSKKRTIALDWIKNNITLWGVGYADEKEIDQINILNATKLAMDRAIIDLKSKTTNNNISNLLIDGSGWENKFKEYKVESIVKGDSKYYSIAAASIVAKEYHDLHIREMVANDITLDTKYSLLSNMGYPTKKHIDGLKKYSFSMFHRKSFNGVV
jgi:ribonuclease HII